jgi:hypothetical protein
VLRKIPRKITYDKSAPTGSLMLVRPDFRFDNEVSSAGNISRVHGAAVALDEAWRRSKWFNEATAQASQLSKDVALDTIRSRMGEALYRAGNNTRKYAGWLAIRPELIDDETGGVVGIALAKTDISGSPVARLVKRTIHREKMYACVSDVDVAPDRQKAYVGAALLDASLSGFKPNQVPTTYVATANPPLIAKLGELGYRQPDSHKRVNLLGEDDLPIEGVRLQASTVEEARSLLHKKYPWLEAAEVEY